MRQLLLQHCHLLLQGGGMRLDRALLNQTAVQHVMRLRRLVTEHLLIRLLDLCAHLIRHLGLGRQTGNRLGGQLDRRQALVLLPARPPSR